jgi:peptidoglycan/LPS O-acetylase OafA/YrhL
VIGAPMARLAILQLAPGHPAAHYVLTICRADALSMGVLLAVGWRNEECKTRFLRHKGVILALFSMVLLAVVILAFLNPQPYSRAAAIWGLTCIDASCAFLLAFATMLPGGLWASICRWPFLRELGRLSYCLYVIHQAINLICHEVIFGTSPRFLGWSTAAVTVLAALLTYALAKLSWTFFERPLLHRGQVYKFFPEAVATSTHSESNSILRTSA